MTRKDKSGALRERLLHMAACCTDASDDECDRIEQAYATLVPGISGEVYDALLAAADALSPQGSEPVGVGCASYRWLATHPDVTEQYDDGEPRVLREDDLGPYIKQGWIVQPLAAPAPAQQADGWIAVSERLPTEDDYGPSDDVLVRYHYADSDRWEVGDSYHDGDDRSYRDNGGWAFGSAHGVVVSHWMPKARLLAALQPPTAQAARCAVTSEVIHQVFPQGVEPHCTSHNRFDIDCIDCSDALERQRKAARGGSDA